LALLRNPRTTSEIASHLGVSRQSIGSRLARLAEAGIIRKAEVANCHQIWEAP
jgi:DNA-binding Lrp family transcriptional regulator